MKFVTGEAAKQGSDAWHDLRRTKIGASSSPALLGVSPYKKADDVFREMVYGHQPFINKAMQHGTNTEQEALDYFNKIIPHYDSDFLPCVLVSDEYDFMMASLDGMNHAKTTVLEIKCPGDSVYNQCEKGKVPIHWEYQIQHQLAVSGLDLAILFVYQDEETNLIIKYNRDEEKIGQIINVCKDFHAKNLLTFTPPSIGTENYKVKSSDEWKHAATAYLNIKRQRQIAEELEEKFHKVLVDLCEGKPSKGEGVVVSCFEKKGNIDYSLIDEIKDLDLEKYRKPAKLQWRICEVKD